MSWWRSGSLTARSASSTAAWSAVDIHTVDDVLCWQALDPRPDVREAPCARRAASWRRGKPSRLARCIHGRARAPSRSACSSHRPASFSCTVFCRRRAVQVREVHPVHVLVLVEAREDDGLLAGLRIDVPLQALRADFLHHALHRRVDAGDRDVVVLQVRRERREARRLDGRHHAVGADGDDAVDASAAAPAAVAELALRVGHHRLDDVAAEVRVLRPARRDRRAGVGASRSPGRWPPRCPRA